MDTLIQEKLNEFRRRFTFVDNIDENGNPIRLLIFLQNPDEDGNHMVHLLEDFIFKVLTSVAKARDEEIIKNIPKSIDEREHNRINKDDPSVHGKWWSRGWNSGYNHMRQCIITSLQKPLQGKGEGEE